MNEIRGIHHLSLSVTDLARSTAWYQAVLGFEPVAETEGTGFRRARLRAPASGLTLSLTAHDGSADSARFDERRIGMDHFAFQVAADDIDILKRRFATLEVVHSEVKTTPGGATVITLRDPDHIQLEVFAPPPSP